MSTGHSLRELDGSMPFEILMRGTGEIIGYEDDGKPIRNRAPKYTVAELREILKSQTFKDFAKLYPKEAVQGDTCATQESQPPRAASADGQAQAEN